MVLPPALRRFPLVVALLVVVGAAGFYVLFYRGQLEYVVGRDSRLLIVAERALAFANDREAGFARSFVRRAGELCVITRRTDATARPEWSERMAYPVRLRDILERIPIGTEAFDLLLVADDKGAVIEQVGSPTLVRFSLDNVVGTDGKTVDVATLWRGSTVNTVSLNGEPHRMFCRPVRLAHSAGAPGDCKDEASPADEARGGFIFCGVVSEKRVTSQAMSISPQVLAALVALLALTLLAPPFVKVSLLGRSERFRFSDAYSLALSTFLALLILSITAVDVAFVRSLRNAANGSLQQLADRVAGNLTSELGRLERQVRAWDAQVVAGPKGAVCPDVFGLGAAPPGPGCPPKQDPFRLEYANVESVSWINGDGQQAVKWSVRPGLKDVRRFRVDGREYFTAVRDGRLWGSPAAGGSEGRYVQAVQTWSSAQTRAVLSLPSSARGVGGAPPPLAVAATASLVSLTDPMLPPLVGFSIVDRQGDVLFHSDAKQALTHNLFEETEGDFDLRSAVLAGVPDFTRGRYWGQRHSFYTRPIPNTPWSVVAFRNEGLLRALNVEVLEDAVGLAGTYALVSFVLPSFIMVLLFKRRASWLWPTEGQGVIYAGLVASLVTTAVLFLLGLASARPDEAVALAFALPWAMLAVVVSCFVLSRFDWSQRWAIAAVIVAVLTLVTTAYVARHPADWRLLLGRAPVFAVALVAVLRLGIVHRAHEACQSWLERVIRANFLLPHLVATLLFWANLAVLPALAFMKASVDTELETLLRHEQLWTAGAYEQRERRLQDFYGVRLRRAAPDRLLERRRLDTANVYTVGLFATQRVGDGPFTPPPAREPATGWLADLLEYGHAHKPLLDPAGAALRHLGMLGSGPSRWAAAEGSGGVREYLGLAGENGSGRALLASVPMSFWAAIGAWPLALTLLVVPLLIYWVRWSVRNIFLVELKPPPTLDLDQLRTCLDGNTLCLVPSSVEMDRALGDGCDRVFCRTAAAPAVSADPKRPIVVQGLNLELLEAPVREPILALLEQWLGDDARRVYVLASSHPSPLLVAGGPHPGGDGYAWKPGEVPRWVRVLSALKVVLVRERRRRRRNGDEIIPEDVARRLLGLTPNGRLPAIGRLLTLEIAAAPPLAELANDRLPDGSLARLGGDDIARRLADLAWGYYWALWNACTRDEKRTLVQLADEAFVNPSQAPAVKRLLEKGLVVRDPLLRPMSESFTVFIRTVGFPDEPPGPGTAAGEFGWADMKLPLISIGLSCGFLVFLSQKDLMDSTVVFVSALGASGVPMLAKLATTLKSLADAAKATGPPRA